MESISRKIERKMACQEKQWEKEFWDVVKDLAEHPVVLQMKQFPHHGSTSCYQHCMNVAYYSYMWCKVLGLDAVSAARAGMLHDLFLYDWHSHKEETGEKFHGITHPKVALKNAEKYFELNEIEKDAILHHMWPIVPWKIPKTKVGHVLTWADKYCGMWESSVRNERRVYKEG